MKILLECILIVVVISIYIFTITHRFNEVRCFKCGRMFPRSYVTEETHGVFVCEGCENSLRR